MSGIQEVGSIMAHFYQQYPNQVYTERMPQDFVIPSMYLTPPITFGEDFTSHSYQKDYSLTVKLFHESEQGAFAEAESIADSIRKARYVVPIRSEENVPTGRFIIVKGVEVRMVDSGSVIMGVAQVTVNWKSRYNYDFPVYQKIMAVYGRFLGKDETL